MAKFSMKYDVLPYWRSYVLVLAPVVLLPLLNSPEKSSKCAYAVILMAVFWMTEALPIAVTSLLPVVLFPLLGIMSTDAVCITYLKETNMMFLGGLMVAIAVEYCNLHKRIALGVLLLVGTSPRWLMFGFMMTTMFLSMWISNTATTAMMVPIVEAVVETLFKNEDELENGHGISIEGSRNGALKHKAIFQVPTTESLPEFKSSEHLVTTRINSDRVVMVLGSDVFEGSTTLQQSQTASTIATTPDALQESEKPLLSSPPDLHRPPFVLKRQSTVSAKSATETDTASFRKAIMLSVAYASNIGGTGTLTGTNPNLVLKGIVDQMFDGKSGINFASWMLFGVPVMFICALVAFAWLQFFFLSGKNNKNLEERKEAIRKVIENQYHSLGRISFHELGVLILFTVLVLLWLFRQPQFIPGWVYFFPDVKIKDATAAMCIVILMFAIPQKLNFWCFGEPGVTQERGNGLLEWKVIQDRMPWGIVLLLGGGFAMAEASKVSGLSKWLGLQLTSFDVMHPALIVFVVCIMTAAITEVASNTATATVLLPVLGNLAQSIGVHPLYLMMPATITCSFAFMLPIATPPNAIVFTSAKMKSMDMIVPGVVMNVLCVGVVTLLINTLGIPIYSLDSFPEWARLNETLVTSSVTTVATPFPLNITTNFIPTS